MTSLYASIKIEDGLNKLSSKDYQNVENWQKEHAVNTAAIRFCRRRIDARETTIKLVDDLQVLLKNVRLSGSDKGVFFQSHRLPTDYFGHSKTTPLCNKYGCTGVRMVSDLVEDANTDELLSDYSSSPSFNFEQTFHTIGGNRIKQYHNKDFEVKELELSYYKQPQYITFPNTPQINGGVGKDMTWEFKDDIADLIIEEAIMILSGNTENANRFSVAQGNLQNNQ